MAQRVKILLAKTASSIEALIQVLDAPLPHHHAAVVAEKAAEDWVGPLASAILGGDTDSV